MSKQFAGLKIKEIDRKIAEITQMFAISSRRKRSVD